MKKLLYIYFLLLTLSVQSQEQITLNFTRPLSNLGSEEKIQVSVQNNDYLIKNGNTISVNVVPDFQSSLKIDCVIPSGAQTSYYLDPKPAQSYEFEVGLKVNGIYIKLLSGEEATQGEQVQQANDQWNTNLKVDRSNGGTGFTAEKTNQTNSVREEWLKRGGLVSYNSLMLTGTYFSLDLSKSGLKTSTTSTSTTPSGQVSGYGGGCSMYSNFVNLKMPEYSTGLSRWNSFNWGLGFDLVIYSFKMPSMKNTILPSTTMTMDMSAIAMNMMIVGNIGWTVGQGRFLNEGTWKGIVLTVKYRPTYNLNYTGVTTTTKVTPSSPYIKDGVTTSSSSSNSFNAKGFGFDIDFSSFSATMDKLAPKPKSKISFFILPPIGKSPLFISLSYGMVFYPNPNANRLKRNK